MNIAIVGSGPSALAAMWACLQHRDSELTMLAPADSTATVNAGVFYLHDPMGLPLRSQEVVISGFGGDQQDYSQKVYGRRDVDVSFPVEQRVETAWDAAQGFGILRDILTTTAVKRLHCRVMLDDFAALSQQYDLVISTAPLSEIGMLELKRAPWSRTAWVYAGAAPEHESYTLYSAHPLTSWYRCSAVHGRFTMETAIEPAAGLEGWHRVVKVEKQPQLPILPQNVILTGRNGVWNKRVLTHHVFQRVLGVLG